MRRLLTASQPRLLLLLAALVGGPRGRESIQNQIYIIYYTRGIILAVVDGMVSYSRWILGGAFVCGIVVVASIVRLSFASVLRRPDPEPRKCNVTRLLDNRRGERVSIREFYRAFVTNRMSSFALCVVALGTGIVWGRRG